MLFCLVKIHSPHTCFFMYSRESLKSELCFWRTQICSKCELSLEWVISLFGLWLILAWGAQGKGIYYFWDLKYSNLHFCRNWKEILDKAIHAVRSTLGNITWKCRFEILSCHQRKRERRGLLMALAIFNYINFPAMGTAARGNFILRVFAMTLAGCSSPWGLLGVWSGWFLQRYYHFEQGDLILFPLLYNPDQGSKNERWNISI